MANGAAGPQEVQRTTIWPPPKLIVLEFARRCVTVIDARVQADGGNQPKKAQVRWYKVIALIAMLVIYQFFNFSILYHCGNICYKGGAWLFCTLSDRERVRNIAKELWWNEASTHVKYGMVELAITLWYVGNVLLIAIAILKPEALLSIEKEFAEKVH